MERLIENVFSYGLRLTHCSFHVGSLHVRMCFFGCISLARIFILRVAEFSLSSYRSSKYFLAVDLQLICPIVITHPMVLQELGRLFSVLANLTLSSNSLEVMQIQDYMSFQPRRRVTPNPANLSPKRRNSAERPSF